MEYAVLRSLVIIFGVSALVVFILFRLRIPSIVGFLISGVIIGPYGVGLIRDTHAVEVMAEVGVILLLFTIGIEFSIAKLARIRKAVVLGGGGQVLLTIVLAALALYTAAEDLRRAVFFGFLMALSSTAVVMKILAERGETDAPHGRMMVGILIFQDLCVVPLMLLTPLLAGEGLSLVALSAKLGKAAFIIVAVLLSARWLVPRLLHEIVSTRSRELFITAIILLCLGIALITSQFGLSLALGAFLAGLIVSESEYAHQATSDILPFKESFMGLFFVSIGMLMDVGSLLSHAPAVLLTVLLIIGLKAVTGTASALLAGAPARTALHAGLGLAQIGEFSFVLAVAGRETGLIPEEAYQIFLSSSVLTMMLTPVLMQIAPAVAGRLTRGLKPVLPEADPVRLQDHVVIVGFGLNGRNLARVLREAGIPYAVLEMNSDTVRSMKKKGEPISYGDGTSIEILRTMRLEQARLLVVAISDPASTRRIVAAARRLNREICIIVRTKYLAEVDDLRALGADEVIPEEFETSIEIFARVMDRYRFPRTVIMEMVERIRSRSYTALRSIDLPRRHLFAQDTLLPDVALDGVTIPDDERLAGRSIGELGVRKRTGATIIAVRRKDAVLQNPPPDFRLQAGDTVLFTGSADHMKNATAFFREGVVPDEA